MTEHYVDIMIDVAPTGQCMDMQSVVMIRNLMVVDDDIAEAYNDKPLMGRRLNEAREETRRALALVGAMSHITFYNNVLRTTPGPGTARANSGDVGTMYAIGTHIAKNDRDTHLYSANDKVPQRLLHSMVICLGRVGKEYFPQVLAVLRDLKSDADMSPVSPMEGSTSHNLRAGYTVEMSVNLGNASHCNVHDASEGYSVWTEDVPGSGKNWYCILPNVHGR